MGATWIGAGGWIRTLFPSWLERLGVTLVIEGTVRVKLSTCAGGVEKLGAGVTLRIVGSGAENVGATVGGAALGGGAGELPVWLCPPGLECEPPPLWAGGLGLGLEWAGAVWCSAAAAGQFQIAAVNVNAARARFVVSDMASILVKV